MVLLGFYRVFVSTTGLESFSLRPEKFSKRFSFSGGCARFYLLSSKKSRSPECPKSLGKGRKVSKNVKSSTYLGTVTAFTGLLN